MSPFKTTGKKKQSRRPLYLEQLRNGVRVDAREMKAASIDQVRQLIVAVQKHKLTLEPDVGQRAFLFRI